MLKSTLPPLLGLAESAQALNGSWQLLLALADLRADTAPDQPHAGDDEGEQQNRDQDAREDKQHHLRRLPHPHEH